jgi:hypothetical protein
MYQPTLYYRRTPAEKADPFLSWARHDTAFFAAGACHILAYLFIQLHPDENFEIIYLKPINGPGNHLYVSNGVWAFDYNGWTLENELIGETRKAYTEAYQGWDFERIVMKTDLETFCKEHNHRAPSHFPYLPWERAYHHIKKFPSIPPAGPE